MVSARKRYLYEPNGSRLRALPIDQMRATILATQLRARGLQSRRERESQQSDDYPKTVMEYATRYRRIDDIPFGLERYEPLRALYEDESPAICVIKPSQRGISEWAITRALFVLDVGARAYNLPKSGLNVLYVFPTDKSLSAFSKERVNGMRSESDHLRAIFKSAAYDDVGFKQIGNSFMYLRGGQSVSGLLSFSADMMVRDEYEEIIPEARALAEKRMNNSVLRHLIDVSTPKLPGLGIHERYMQSDQRIYLQECPNCGDENQYDFFRDVTVNGARFDQWEHWEAQQIRRCDVALTCPKCEYILTKTDRCVPGRYEAQQPDVQGLRGYWVPALAFPVVNLLDLAVKAVDPDPTAVEQFMRQDLGVPYHSKGSGISEEDLVPLSLGLENGRLPGGPWMRTTMGVDVGGRYHVRITSQKKDDPKRYVRYMNAVGSWQEIDDLMELYNVQMCVVDSMPDQHGAAAFVGRHKGRAVIGDYPTNMGALKGTLFAPERRKAVQDGFVRINRTMALDAVMTAVVGQREHWPTQIINDPEVRANMTAGARVTSIDKKGQVVAAWIRLKADHYLHACAYENVARLLTPQITRPGRIIQASAKTQMPSGTNYTPPPVQRG